MNTGKDTSKNNLSLMSKIALMRITNDDGDANGFVISELTAAGSTKILDAINNGDPSKRLYPIDSRIENPVINYYEKIKETPMSGIPYTVFNKTRPSEFYLFQVSFAFAEVLQSFENSGDQWGFVYLDTYDSLVGKKDAETKLRLEPIPIQSFFLDEATAPTDSATNKMKVGFSIDIFPVELIYMIPSNQHNFSTSKWKGLYDYAAEYVSKTGTGAEATAMVINLSKYLSGNPLSNVEDTNFSIAKVAAGVATPITYAGFTENTVVRGQYSFTFTTLAISASTFRIIISSAPSTTTGSAVLGISPNYVEFTTPIIA